MLSSVIFLFRYRHMDIVSYANSICAVDSDHLTVIAVEMLHHFLCWEFRMEIFILRL